MATRLSIFPLPGAILFPGLHLPLHIFEPRYRALVGDALARDRRIAMIQPHTAAEGAPLFAVGCVGKIEDVEALDDGRYNIVLAGEARFRLARELEVATPSARSRASCSRTIRTPRWPASSAPGSSRKRAPSPTRRATWSTGIRSPGSTTVR